MPMHERHYTHALEAVLARVAECTILCVGDLMLDVEVECEGARISPEAPIAVVEEGRHRSTPGGAANVASNVAALGARTILAGVVGADKEGATLRRSLPDHGVDCRFVEVSSAERPTTRKTRFLCAGQQLLRLDREVRRPLTVREAECLLSEIVRTEKMARAIIVSDYGKGTVTEEVMASLVAMGEANRIPVLVDPKGTDWARYGAVRLIKPNSVELADFVGLPCDTDAQVEVALRTALDRCQAQAILVTRAGRGASLLARGRSTAEHMRAQALEVVDVCGAGDTNLAMLGAALGAGIDLLRAAELAQLASSLAVKRRGNAIVGAAELLDHCADHANPHSAQVHSFDSVLAQVNRWRKNGLRVGFTNGCFDIVHAGHIRTLQAARSRCDRLVVGLNSDASICRLKGPQRPAIGERDRARVLAAIGAVDAVVVFEEDTPERLIQALCPDLLCKGGDYAPDTIAGAEFVRSYGGEVLVTELVADTSTSSIIDSIQDRQQFAARSPFEKAGNTT